jgi:hypothetical protein
MAGNKSRVDPKDAFQLYMDMGDKRSVNGVFTELKARGYAIGRQTVIDWHRDNEWDKRIPEVLAARQLEVEAATIKHTAAEILEEAGALPAEDVKPLRTLAVFDTGAGATLEAAALRLNALVAGMSAVAIDHVRRLEDYLDPPQLILLINATRDLARGAADVHKALNPPAPKLSKQDIEALPVINPGRPGAMIPDDLDELEEALMNPPRLNGKL